MNFNVNNGKDVIKVPADTTIVVNGDNFLKCADYGKAIHVEPSGTDEEEYCDLTIQGTGKLDCVGESASIVVPGELRIQNVSVATNSEKCLSARNIILEKCNVEASHYTGVMQAGSPLIEAYIDSDSTDCDSDIALKDCYIKEGGYIMEKTFSPKYDGYVSTFIGAGNEYAKKVIIKAGQIPEVTKPSIPSVSSNYTKNTIKWSVPKYMQGSFEVYRSTNKTAGYKKVASVNVPYFTDSNLTFNKTYYYKIRVKNYRSTAESAVKSCKTALQKPVVNVKKISSTAKKLSWTKISGAQGYKVYRATSKSGTYKYVKKVTKGSTVAWSDKGLKKNKKYYYKVKAYRVVNGKAVYSSTSVAAGN